MYTGKMFGIALITSFLVSLVVCAVFFFVLPMFVSVPSLKPRVEKSEITVAALKQVLAEAGVKA